MKNSALAILAIQAVFVSLIYAQEEPSQAEREFATSIIANTSDLSSDENILIASMFVQQYDPDKTPELLSIDLHTPEYNRIRYSLTAYYCLLGGTASLCDTPFDTRLINLDQDNLEPHLYAMLNSTDAGSPETALAALTRGNSAPHLNNYYFDKLNLLRTILANTHYPVDKINGASEVLAGAGSMYTLYAKVLAICTERSIESEGWKTQCLTLGRRLENEGKTAMQNVFGFAIQRDSLGNSPSETEERNSVLARRDTFNAIRDRASEHLEWWSKVSLKTDELYRDMAEQGEIQVVQQALEQQE